MIRVIGDRYQLDPLPLGAGGMGEVWGGYDRQLERRVAVKVIRFPDGKYDEQLRRRFLTESKVLARLAHPGAPVVYDAGTFEDPLAAQPRLFMVMEFVQGQNVDILIGEQHPLPVGWAAGIAAQVCAVLAAAHELSIYHRDLKPANLLFCVDGTIKVIDFGLALLTDPGYTRLTVTGQLLGTAEYMSPEQVRHEPIDARSDLYSLGCVLHELLTGHRLFGGGNTFTVMTRQIQDAPEPVTRFRRVPPELERLVLRLLEKRPADRPGSAEEVYDALLPFVTGLGPLGDFLRAGSSPTRMYAGVVSRVLAPQTSPPTVAEEPEEFGEADLGLARRQAESLIRESRFDQAADILSGLVEPANAILGPDNSEVIDLRSRLAGARYEGRRYADAAEDYAGLARDLARLHGADDERVLHCRLREATCRAHADDLVTALEKLGNLLQDELRIFGADDPRTLELRRQIGLLQSRRGDGAAARRTLTELHDDLVQLHGDDHPAPEGIRTLLKDI
ncbi:serine/threonine-protein kinase [Sphaerisporangium perillae]|uniref:serine/threonine-protein kinase n=1 Tax=Sphaerisporangium perillae TaxID=2935860 RepID=UPI00200F1D28|nr:serine/threonine-protein kinase [Sphaerisporangium perillae]